MEKTDIVFTRIGAQSDILVVQVHGALDTMAAYKFREDIEAQVKNGTYKYIIDLQPLDYISSAGIGVFPAIAPALKGHDGGIVFINVAEKTLKLFKMIGLTTIFGVKDSLEQAIREFEPNAS